MDKKNKLINIVCYCYNEEGNIKQLYEEVKAVMSEYPEYDYKHTFIDNASEDNTVKYLKEIAKEDQNVRIIVNSRNFGHIRSPFHAFKQSEGDATILMASDLQEPPQLIKEFIKKWEEGYKVVKAVKNKSKEFFIKFWLRKLFYFIIGMISDIKLTSNFVGFGLYDKQFLDIIKNLNEPYPYLRGLIAEFEFDSTTIQFTQPKRKKGRSKNNFFTLFDMMMLGFVNYSKLPLRIATLIGFIFSFFSFLAGLAYFVYKIVYWDSFELGIAPLIIGFFFFASIILFFMGVVGEYVGNILTRVTNRPLVVEKERVNFDSIHKENS